MKLPKLLTGILLLGTFMFTLSSCSDDDATPVPRKQTYSFTGYGEHEITGTALFTEILNTDSVEVTVTLKGKEITNLVALPVVIREGTSLESGDVIDSLGEFKGSQGQLIKKIKLSFDDLLNLNGSMTVYGPSDEILSQAEIGTNTEFESHTLTGPNLDGEGGKMNGQFRVYKRETGSYIVVKVDLEGQIVTCQGADHPVNVYKADGARDFELSPVSDATGLSATSLPDKPYKDLKNYNGTLKVLCSETAKDITISQGTF